MALTADAVVDYSDNQIYEYPVSATRRIYEGSIVVMDQFGRVRPGEDIANVIFIGIAREGADNRKGGHGDINVKVYTRGRVRLRCTGLLPGVLGNRAYVREDDSFYIYGFRSGQTPKATNNVTLGRFVRYISSTEGWIAFNAPVT